MTLSPPVRVSASFKVVAGSRLARRWSSEAISRLLPSRTVPPSGAPAPVSMSSSVVLPAPFGPTMPSRSPRAMRSERSRISVLPPSALETSFGLDDQLAGDFRAGHRELHRAADAFLLAPLAAELLQRAVAAHVALAPRRHAVAHPVELGGDFSVEFLAVALLALEHLVAPGLELAEAAVDLPHGSAIEPEGGARQRGEEAAVVADQHDGRADAHELRLQPLDGRQVEMVRRLVEDEHVGLRRESARQARPPRLAAGQVLRVFGSGEPELGKEILRAVWIVARRKARLDIGERGRKARKVRLLRQVAHRGALAQHALAAVRLDEAGHDLQERRLARAVAPDQRQPLALADGRARRRQAAAARRSRATRS